MPPSIFRAAIPCLAALLLASGCVASRQAASLASFEAALAGRDSATATLEAWCAERGLADPARVTAEPADGPAMPLPPQDRAALGVSPEEPLGYRHVRLACGGRVLSDARNWYVPARLPREMNDTLETTDTPFGKVVAPLGFRRERLSSERGAAEGCPQGTVLSHRALLRLPDGRAISLVLECYLEENLR